MNDIGDDLALGFHALEIVDVDETEDEGVDCGVIEAIADGDFEPAPAAILALEAAADFAIRGGALLGRLELGAKQGLFVGMKKIEHGGAGKLVGRVAEEAAEWVVYEEQRAVGMDEGEEFLGGIEERGEVLEAQTDSLLGWGTLSHVVAVQAAGGKNAAGGGDGAASAASGFTTTASNGPRSAIRRIP